MQVTIATWPFQTLMYLNQKAMELLGCLSILSGLLRGNWSVTTHSQGKKKEHVWHVRDSPGYITVSLFM